MASQTNSARATSSALAPKIREMKAILNAASSVILSDDGAVAYRDGLLKKVYTILEQIHPYKLKQLQGADKRWQTYVLKDGQLKQIKGKTKQKLQDKLVAFYCISDEDYTLESYFDKVYLPEREALAKKRESISMLKARFEKYVRGTMLGGMRLVDIKTVDLESWATHTIRDNDLTAHCWNTYKGSVTGMLRMAKKAELIKKNPWDEVEIERSLFRTQKQKEAKKMIFYEDETQEIIKECIRGYENNGNVANMALLLNFELGLRVGELVALKMDDFDWKNKTVRIERQESDGEIENYVKSDSVTGYRTLAVSDSALAVVRKVFSITPDRYLFCNDGKRINTRTVARRLEKIQKKLKYPYVRETHCIRRTVASKMSADGIPIDEIRRWLGHTTKETTYKYIFNYYRSETTDELHRKNSLLNELAV